MTKRIRIMVMPLFLAAISIVVSGPSRAEVMSGEQIIAQIVGKDLVTRRTGMKVHLRYDADGTITVKAPLFHSSGRWALVGNSLCMTLTEGPRQGETCHVFEVNGDGTYRNSEGQTFWEQ